jgi:S-adenosylmethionine-diacylgycerolhomoserine-N-methlytransferase
MSDDIARSMDRMYRLQRHFYDFTRKYYLFGRDELVDDLGVRQGETVLEVGCGTGRNLVRLAGRYPGARLLGLDASAEMLKSATTNLERRGWTGRVHLCQGYAQTFTPALFDLDDGFDRILFSYTLSIIPEPIEALDNALAQLKPGGTLHVVDFCDRAELPAVFDAIFTFWLKLFGVAHRPEVGQWFVKKAEEGMGYLKSRTIMRRYAEFLTLRKA